MPVLGYGTDAFPGFYRRDSGFPVPWRVDDPAQVAAVWRAHRDAGRRRGHGAGPAGAGRGRAGRGAARPAAGRGPGAGGGARDRRARTSRPPCWSTSTRRAAARASRPTSRWCGPTPSWPRRSRWRWPGERSARRRRRRPGGGRPGDARGAAGRRRGRPGPDRHGRGRGRGEHRGLAGRPWRRRHAGRPGRRRRRRATPRSRSWRRPGCVRRWRSTRMRRPPPSSCWSDRAATGRCCPTAAPRPGSRPRTCRRSTASTTCTCRVTCWVRRRHATQGWRRWPRRAPPGRARRSIRRPPAPSRPRCSPASGASTCCCPTPPSWRRSPAHRTRGLRRRCWTSPRAVVVTEGRAGATWVDRDGTWTVPAPAVDVVDATGAGDAFDAGLLAAWLAGRRARRRRCRRAARRGRRPSAGAAHVLAGSRA